LVSPDNNVDAPDGLLVSAASNDAFDQGGAGLRTLHASDCKEYCNQESYDCRYTQRRDKTHNMRRLWFRTTLFEVYDRSASQNQFSVGVSSM
jgi:hypothetical protein